MTNIDSVVIVKGIAGLGNRLRVVAAAIEYAQKTGRIIYVDWKDGMFASEGTNAFYKYFRITDFPYVDDFSQLSLKTFYPEIYGKLPMDNSIYNYYEKKQINNRFIRKGFHYIFVVLHKIGNIFPFFQSVICKLSLFYQAFVLRPEYRKKYGQKGRFAFGAHLSKSISADAVIFCDNIPFYKPEIMKNNIALQPWVLEKIDEFVKEKGINKDTVSVHIRASGKKCYGDIKKFVPKLRAFIQEHDIKKVFLCTDNNETEHVFREEFGDMLITQDKYIPEIRDGETGIHDYAHNTQDEELKDRLTLEAIIDMFAMTRTDYLFYQFGSTFSEISKVYQQKDHTSKSWLSL